MDLKEIVSIAGIGGLKRIIKQRPDGLIVADMDGSGKKFMSNRIHMFSPLENISIYTQNDSEPLPNVLWKMKQLAAETPPISPKSDAEALKEYMAKVLPEYDRDQVFVSDMKKLIRWYEILEEYQMISDPAVKEDGAPSESDPAAPADDQKEAAESEEE